MHFGVPWIEPQRFLIFQQRRLQFALLGQRTGQVRVSDAIVRVQLDDLAVLGDRHF